MALIDGDDFVSGDILSYQEGNRLKNHWRGPSAPANIKAGMLFSDSDDNKLYHMGGAPEEVLQLTRSVDKTPQFDNLVLDVDESDVSDPPQDSELDAIFPVHPDGFIGFVKDTTSGGSLWMVTYHGGWWYVEMTLAV